MASNFELTMLLTGFKATATSISLESLVATAATWDLEVVTTMATIVMIGLPNIGQREDNGKFEVKLKG